MWYFFLTVACVVAWASADKAVSWDKFFEDKFEIEGLETNAESDSLTGVQFVLASSTSEKKVTYAQLENFVAQDKRLFPLIDAGLRAPKAIAWDRYKGWLYVADSDSRKIMAYQIKADVDKETFKKTLFVAGSPIVIVSGYVVDYLYVDSKSALYFTDDKTVYMLDWGSVHALTLRELDASDLKVKNVEAKMLAAGKTLPGGLAPLPERCIWEMFKANKPGGVSASSDGVAYFGKNSLTGGTIVEGLFAGGTQKSERDVITEKESINGIAFTYQLAVYATNDAKVLGVPLDGVAHTKPIVLASTLKQPRQVAFDGDGTIYVADQGAGAVYSLPAGTRRSVTPDQVALFNGAFGVTVIRGDDPGLQIRQSEVSTTTSLFTV